MAGRGMGAATKGGGCVGTGPRNKVESKPSRKVGDPVMMNKGGDVKKKSFPDMNKDGKVTKADVLMGRGVQKKMDGGMMKKYRKGGAACK